MNKINQKKLIKFEWFMRYTIYTAYLTVATIHIFQTLPHLLFFKIWFTLLTILLIFLHLDTFKILYKVFMKAKKISWKFFKV